MSSARTTSAAPPSAGRAERIEYVLICGRPRPSIGGAGVIYETRRLRAKHAGDNAAIRWATRIVPDEDGLQQAERRYPAVPMVLRRGRTVVWQGRPGLALRIVG